MKHILANTKKEIQYSKEKMTYIKNVSGFSFFQNSLSDFYEEYFYLKENLLLYYSSVFSDISRDINDSKINAQELLDIQKSMQYVNTGMKQCFEALQEFEEKCKEKYKENQDIQNILFHEKTFLREIFINFSLDIQKWFSHHKSEIEDEIQKMSELQDKNIIPEWISILELQKTRFQMLIEKI